MIARPVSFHSSHGISVVQMATGEQDSFAYVSLGSALKKNLVEVKEVSQTGDVNTLVVLNASNEFVFMMDGDVLAGAKQNRVVNTSILLAPKSKTFIPVSCVEQGRWHHTSPKFTESNFVASPKLRADKARSVRGNLKKEKGFDANQGEVWNFVSKSQVLYQMESPTSNLSDVYEKREKDFNALVQGFVTSPGANGLALFAGNQLKGLDIFNRRDIYGEYFPKILRAAAFDTFHTSAEKKSVGQQEAEYRMLDFLDRVTEKNDEQERYPGVGVGSDLRFELEGMAGFELSYNERMIHFTAMNAT
jgi:hypothetical protein